MKILIVEDDAEARAYLLRAFAEAGHEADEAPDGRAGLDRALERAHDVLIVDRMMPKMDGLAMIQALRGRGVETPALILSALGQVDDRVVGLRAGGDDYLAKPYAFAELLARVEILGRRAAPQVTTLRCGDLTLDRLARKAWREGEELLLQPREFRLLEFLMRREGQVVTRAMLLEGVWDLHFDPQTNVIDVHMSKLRGKIDKGRETPLLQTIRGAGYVIRDGAS
jgi:two-component system OmpR family response regulator